MTRRALRRVTLAGMAVPVLCGTARRNKGVQPLMDAVAYFLPSPLDRGAVSMVDEGGKALMVEPDGAGPLSALVFKLVHDRHRGLLAFVRVYSGTLEAKAQLLNTTRGGKERSTRLLEVHAEEHREVPQVAAGGIAAIVGLKGVHTGDTLVAPGRLRRARLAGVDVPEPVFTCSIEPGPEQDEDDFEAALELLQREDPSVRVGVDPETGQRLMSGMGELHLEVVVARLQSQHGVRAASGPMRVAYRERPRSEGSAAHTLDRVVAGRPQLVTLTVEVAPAPGLGAPTCVLEPAAAEVGLGGCDAVERWELTQALEGGVLAACSRGVRRGFQMLDTAIRITALELGDDAGSAAVALAASEATGAALAAADVGLLQPVMAVEVTVGAELVGGVVGDLTGQRRATVFGIELAEGDPSAQTVRAEVPLAGMVGYDGVLRSLTSGTGAFSMDYARHELMDDAAAARTQLW